jgi:hypothetical protein
VLLDMMMMMMMMIQVMMVCLSPAHAAGCRCHAALD